MRRAYLAWGRRGARAAADRGDQLVVVDTLSFSTAVATAVQHGAIVYPCAEGEDLAAVAAARDAEAAVHRTEVPERGRFSLSPLTYRDVAPGTRVALWSPNGATCSRYGRAVPRLFVAAPVNASAVAARLDDHDVTVLACGERWRDDGTLRVAVEDYLGAGAVLAALDAALSPEAEVCAGAFRAAERRLPEIIWDCLSGRELRELGFADDVRHAAQLDVFDAAPVMEDDALRPAEA